MRLAINKLDMQQAAVAAAAAAAVAAAEEAAAAETAVAAAAAAAAQAAQPPALADEPPPAFDAAAGEAPLPAGWVVATSRAGLRYYANSATGESRWTHPAVSTAEDTLARQ